MRLAKLLYFFYGVFLLVMAYHLYRSPEYNWDSLPYMAVVLSYEGETPKQVHQQVYRIAQEEIPVDQYRLLIDSTNLHRKRALQQIQFFSSLSPMYVVKPMYTRLCWLLYKAGIPLLQSTYIVSIISYILLGCILLFWLVSRLKPLIAALLSAAVMLMPFMTETARLSTPDMLSALLVFTMVFFLIEYKRLGSVAIISILAILTRIDNIIPVFIILTGYKLCSHERLSWKIYLLGFAAITITFLWVSSLASSYGFSWMYIDSYISSMKMPDTRTRLYTTDLEFLVSQLSTGLRHSSFAIFALFGLISLVYRKHAPQLNWLILAIGICVAIRFLLQPVIADRFFIPYYLLIIIVASIKVFELLSFKKTVNVAPELQTENSKL